MRKRRSPGRRASDLAWQKKRTLLLSLKWTIITIVVLLALRLHDSTLLVVLLFALFIGWMT